MHDVGCCTFCVAFILSLALLRPSQPSDAFPSGQLSFLHDSSLWSFDSGCSSWIISFHDFLLFSVRSSSNPTVPASPNDVNSPIHPSLQQPLISRSLARLPLLVQPLLKHSERRSNSLSLSLDLSSSIFVKYYRLMVKGNARAGYEFGCDDFSAVEQ